MSAAEAEPNDKVRPVVGAVVIVLAIWNLLGWFAGLGVGNPVAWLLAAMTVGFELLAFNASVQMRRANEKKRLMARNIWVAALAMCSGWSIYSAHHALGVFAPMPELDALTFDAVLGLMHAAPAAVVLTVAAFLVPLLPWAIEETEKAESPAAPPSVTAPVETTPPRPVRRRLSLVEAGAMAGVAVMAPNVATGAVVQPQTRAAPASDASREVSRDDVVRASGAIRDAGGRPSYRTVAAHLGVPVSRVERAWTKGVPL